MKYLYKYPQAAYPYEDLIETNRHRGRQALEYELLDTGVFGEDRYFDIFAEYAKAGPDDVGIRIGKWVAPFLILGIYNKLVKLHDEDGTANA